MTMTMLSSRVGAHRQASCPHFDIVVHSTTGALGLGAGARHTMGPAVIGDVAQLGAAGDGTTLPNSAG